MSKRYENFDILRGLAIIAVILIHVTAPLALDGDILGIVLNQVTRFGVPVFVFLSGWGLTVAKSYERSENYWDFLKGRVSKILPSYLMWNLIYWIYQNWMVEAGSLPLNEFLPGIIRGTNYAHLYFVPLIIVFYLIYPLLLEMGKSKIGVLFTLIVSIVSQRATTGNEIQDLTRNHNLLNWLFYFVLGIWVAYNLTPIRSTVKKYRKAIILFTILSAFVLVLESFLRPKGGTDHLILMQTRPNVIFYSVMVILFIILVPVKTKWLKGFLDKLSGASFNVYLSHYLFLSVLRTNYLDLGMTITPILYIPLMFVLVLGLSLLVDEVGKRITN